MLILEALGIMGRIIMEYIYPRYAAHVGFAVPITIFLDCWYRWSQVFVPSTSPKPQSTAWWPLPKWALLKLSTRAATFPPMTCCLLPGAVVRCGACGDTMGKIQVYIGYDAVSDIPLFYIYIYIHYTYIYIIYICCEITRQPVVNLLQLLLYAPFCLLAYKCKL